MKKILIILGLLLSTVALYAVISSTIAVKTNESFTTSAAAHHDTSSTFDLSIYDKVYLVSSVTGTDSVKLKIYVDGLGQHSKWDLNIYNDSLIVDNGTGDYTKGMVMWDDVTRNITGYRSLRIRTDVSSGAADDSSSALMYSQYFRVVK